jgi:hypothetical protein
MRACAGAFGGEGFGPGGEEGFPGDSGVMEECFAEIGFEPTKPPSADMREKIEACVRGKMGDEFGGPGGEGGGPPEIPEEAKDCVRAAIGVDDFSKLRRPPTQAQQAEIQKCFEEAGGGFGPGGGEFDDGEHGDFPGEGDFEGAPGEFPGPGSSRGGFGPSSPEVQACMNDLGISSSRPPSASQMSQIEACVREKVGDGSPEGDGGHQGFPSNGFPGDVPPQGFSPDQFQSTQGGFTPEQIQQQIIDQQTQAAIQAQQQQIQQLQTQQEHAAQCTAGGGTWNGTTCVIPTGPQPGGFLYQPSPQARLNPPSLLGFFGQVLGILR